MSDSLTCPSCGTVCEQAHRFCPGCGFPMEKLRDNAVDPLIGCTLPGGHVVLELIDVGGMGRVYRAEQKMLGRTVAVKIIHPHLLGDETVAARFITEARAASQLNHPNSVGVIDFGKFEGRLYMVMEYLRGRDLATVAHEEAPLAVDRIIDIMVQALAALEEAHAIGIIHRDLKPENLVLSPLRSGGDFVKVLDFGLAKVLELAKKKRITDPGMVCGTPEYMAPEQARGDNVDHRADLYACGVLLFELLAGQLPFDGDTPREIVLQHLSKLPPDIRKLAPDRDVPERLLDVVARALAKDPSERFQSASEMVSALKDAVAPEVGAIQDASSAPLVACADCGVMMPRTQKFCGECGSPLRGNDQAVIHTERPAAAERRTVRLPLPFSGRGDEIKWLATRRSALRSSLMAITISGPAGVGKTRLLRELLTSGAAQGDRVVLVRPDPWWVQRGYHVLRTAIVGLAGLPEDGGEPAQWAGASGEARAGIERIFEHGLGHGARSARAWAGPPPDTGDSGGVRELCAEALRWALSRAQRLADGGAVILAIDDLHAADGASLGALRAVLTEPPLCGALVVGTHRGGFEPGWPGAGVLELGGLSTPLGAALLSGGDPAAAERAEPASPGGARVLPMYLEQLVRYTREGGEDPPPKLADLLALRVERLDADTRRVLQAVAVLGDASQAMQLAGMLPDTQDVERYLSVLEQAGFVLVADGVAGCRHPLIRDIVLASIPRGVRSDLHARARQKYADDQAEMPLEAHALHAYEAGESFQALMLLEQSAERARRRDDADGAVTALRLALELARRELMRGELDDPVGAVLMFSCKLGDALLLAGHHTDADGVLSEALAMTGPQARQRPHILASLANAARVDGRAGDAYGHLDEALRVAEKLHQTDLVDELEGMRQRWVAGG